MLALSQLFLEVPVARHQYMYVAELGRTRIWARICTDWGVWREYRRSYTLVQQGKRIPDMLVQVGNLLRSLLALQIQLMFEVWDMRRAVSWSFYADVVAALRRRADLS